MYNAKMSAQIGVLQSKALDIALPREREAMLQRSIVALHTEFGFGQKRIKRYIDAMESVNTWMSEIANDYMQDVQQTTDRAADRKRIDHECNEFVLEKLRERAQRYSLDPLMNVSDIE